VGLANLGSELKTSVGSCVRLVGVSMSFEKNFYWLPFTPPSLVRRIGPSLITTKKYLLQHQAIVLLDQPTFEKQTWRQRFTPNVPSRVVERTHGLLAQRQTPLVAQPSLRRTATAHDPPHVSLRSVVGGGTAIVFVGQDSV
jgi:hypothetical protein